MLPTFRSGKKLIFHGVGTLQDGATLAKLVGRVVLIERESYPGIYFIKRVVRLDGRQIWVEGDNREESSDSRQWGYIQTQEIIAIALRR